MSKLKSFIVALTMTTALAGQAEAATTKYYARAHLPFLNNVSVTYTPTYGPYSTCTASANGATQTATIASCATNDGTVVDNSLCTPQSKTQTCYAGTWRNGGTATSDNTCTNHVTTTSYAPYCRGSTGATIADANCDPSTKPAPTTMNLSCYTCGSGAIVSSAGGTLNKANTTNGSTVATGSANSYNVSGMTDAQITSMVPQICQINNTAQYKDGVRYRTCYLTRSGNVMNYQIYYNSVPLSTSTVGTSSQTWSANCDEH